MNHIMSGHNFHGRYRVVLRGPKAGFVLSPTQERRVNQALCGMTGCTCGGGYGDGPDRDSARVEWDGDHGRLFPAA